MNIPFKSLLCAVAVSSLVVSTAPGQDAKPDAEGYVHHWLMLAPIALGDGADAAELIGQEQIEKESALTPKAGDKVKVKDQELTWKSVHSDDAAFDLNVLLNAGDQKKENVVGYMVAYLVCDKELTDLTLLVGSNDEGRLYLNGKEVFKDTEPRALEKDSDKVEHLTLKQGVNTIVFKVINESNDWQGCVRFTDKSGKPVTDFAVKLSP